MPSPRLVRSMHACLVGLAGLDLAWVFATLLRAETAFWVGGTLSLLLPAGLLLLLSAPEAPQHPVVDRVARFVVWGLVVAGLVWAALLFIEGPSGFLLDTWFILVIVAGFGLVPGAGFVLAAWIASGASPLAAVGIDLARARWLYAAALLPFLLILGLDALAALDPRFQSWQGSYHRPIGIALALATAAQVDLTRKVRRARDDAQGAANP